MNDKTGNKTIQAVDRAVEILRCFEQGDTLGVTEISRRLDLHKSTAFGLINTLVSNRLLEKAPDSEKYRLGIELFRLGSKAQSGIREICAPHVKQLMEVTGETANLVLPDGGNVVYVDKRESQHSMRICTSVGLRLPMYCTAVGKAILAFMNDKEREAIIGDMQFASRTEKTITSKEALLEQLDRIKQDGYAIDDEELEYGLICVAVPILGKSGEPIAAISVSGPKPRMTKEKIREVHNELMTRSNDISRVTE